LGLAELVEGVWVKERTRRRGRAKAIGSEEGEREGKLADVLPGAVLKFLYASSEATMCPIILIPRT
jgi:hypothetical protein